MVKQKRAMRLAATATTPTMKLTSPNVGMVCIVVVSVGCKQTVTNARYSIFRNKESEKRFQPELKNSYHQWSITLDKVQLCEVVNTWLCFTSPINHCPPQADEGEL